MTRLVNYIKELEELVRPCVGRKLREIVYGTIDGECNATDVAAGIRWISGEARVRFDERPVLYIGWGENDGWPDHFSLAVQSVTTFKPGALVDFVANHAPEWQRHVGAELLRVDCLGANDTPHALLLVFPAGAVAIGDGHEGVLGDGDDVVVLPADESNIRELGQRFWSCGG